MGRSVVSLRFFGDTLDPDEITQLLGKAPSSAERKGDVVGPRKNRTARQGSWRLSVEDRQPDDLPAQIEEIFSDATSDLSIWHALAQKYQVDLFCGIFLDGSNEEYHVSPSALLTLGERCIRLSLDIYADVESDEEPATS